MALTTKKGDKVLLRMFTGCIAGVKDVIAADKTTITLNTRLGETKFSRKTGKQIEPAPSQERYASYIEEWDGKPIPPRTKKAAKPSKKKQPEPEVEEVEAEEAAEVEEEVAETVKPSKKGAKKPAKKAAKKKLKTEEDEDDEDFDEDEFEEA